MKPLSVAVSNRVSENVHVLAWIVSNSTILCIFLREMQEDVFSL